MSNEINAGYEIIHKFQIGDNLFVIGKNEKAPAKYVTWEYCPKKKYYFWGHYFQTEKDAMIDITRRMENALFE